VLINIADQEFRINFAELLEECEGRASFSKKADKMASDQSYVDYILEQIQDAGELNARKMFGEYGIWSDGKIFALICNNKLFIKPTESGRVFIGDVVEAPPYEGAKPSFLIEDKVEDREWLSELVRITVKELPEPKAKKKKIKRTKSARKAKK